MSTPKMELDDDENTNENQIQEKPKKSLPQDTNKWPLEMQTAVLNAFLHYKPVGINAAFRMGLLLEYLYSSTPKSNSSTDNSVFQSQKHSSLLSEYDITSDDVWNYLRTLYDLPSLHQTESAAGSPVKKNAEDFVLPETDFGTLMRSKEQTSSKSASISSTAHESSPPPSSSSKQKKTKKPLVRQVTVGEDTESVSSSRSSTPASGGNTTNAAVVVSTPTLRRSRHRKD